MQTNIFPASVPCLSDLVTEANTTLRFEHLNLTLALFILTQIEDGLGKRNQWFLFYPTTSEIVKKKVVSPTSWRKSDGPEPGSDEKRYQRPINRLAS